MTPMTDTSSRNGSTPELDIETTADDWVPGPPATTTGRRLRQQTG